VQRRGRGGRRDGAGPGRASGKLYFVTPPLNPRIIPGNTLAHFKLHHLEACPDVLRAIFQSDGFLHFQHDLPIPGGVRAAAEALALHMESVGIFTFSTGNGCNGCIGDGLRRQTPVSAGAPCLRAFAGAVGAGVGLIATRLQVGAGRPLTVQPPMVLNNCVSRLEPGLVAGVQDLHRDYGGRALAFNALVPLQDTTLLVVQAGQPPQRRGAAAARGVQAAAPVRQPALLRWLPGARRRPGRAWAGAPAPALLRPGRGRERWGPLCHTR
jgi:hypothetical protein